jgi:hypothetical protein
MPELILTDAQTALIAKSGGRVTVRDTKGNLLGFLESPLTSEEIADLKRRAASPGPFFTAAQVQARLRALQQEWERLGGFDATHMRQFLAKLDEADPGHMRPKGKAG